MKTFIDVQATEDLDEKAKEEVQVEDPTTATAEWAIASNRRTDNCCDKGHCEGDR